MRNYAPPSMRRRMRLLLLSLTSGAAVLAVAAPPLAAGPSTPVPEPVVDAAWPLITRSEPPLLAGDSSAQHPSPAPEGVAKAFAVATSDARVATGSGGGSEDPAGAGAEGTGSVPGSTAPTPMGDGAPTPSAEAAEAAAPAQSAPAAAPPAASTPVAPAGAAPATEPPPPPPPPPPPAPPAAAVAPAPAGADAEFVAGLNRIRAGAGLPALTRDGELDQLAASWSAEMASSGQLRHSSLLPGLAQRRGVVAGENVGHGTSVPGLLDAFVASSGHYANIVSPGFTRVGVATVSAPDGSLWTTHIFTG